MDTPLSSSQKKTKDNRIVINLSYESNKFFTDILTKWCKMMTKRGIAEILANHYSRLGAAKLEKILDESIVDQEGDFTINKSVLDAFVLYSAQELEKVQGIFGPACEITGCTRNAVFGFAKSQTKPGARLCNQHKLPGMVREHACTECEHLKSLLSSSQKSVTRWKVAAHRAQKKLKKLRESTQTHGGKEKLIMFNLISKREKERRISKAREHLIKRTVGSYTRDFVLTTWAAREQVFENTVKCLLLNSSPLDDKVSPLKLENVVRKVPEIKRVVQRELDEIKEAREEDMIEKCRRWIEIRKNFLSIDSSRSVLESGFEPNKTGGKRSHLKPKKHESQSGLVVSDPKIVIDYSAEKAIRSFLSQNFNGIYPEVKTCYELIPVRHGICGLKEFLEAIYARYSSTIAQERYRLKFFDENTGAEVETFYNVKMAIDGCTRRSCGAAAPGGDINITNFVLSVADFPLTTGRTDHSFLAASINSGESAIWPKLLLFLWAQELGFVEVASGDGQMEVGNQKLTISL